MDPKDLVTYIGIAAIYLLSVNVLLGLLMGARYNTYKRWPRRRMNILKLHNWTAYVALGLSLLHPLPLLFVDEPKFRLIDLVWPLSSTYQPIINTLGALALYLLAFTVVTSIYRAAIGRSRWLPLHYLTYALAVLFVIHGTLTNQHLDDKPVDLIDAEKVGFMACGLVILVATVVRVRWALRHPKYHPPNPSGLSGRFRWILAPTVRGHCLETEPCPSGRGSGFARRQTDGIARIHRPIGPELGGLRGHSAGARAPAL